MTNRKQELRNRYLICRNNLSVKERQEKSIKIWEQLKKEEVFKKARIILVYMNYRSEVITTGLVEELFALKDKRIFAPKVEGMDIHFYEVSGMEDFEDGYQKIREPRKNSAKQFTGEMEKDNECLILVPGAVFDQERGRIGYGKGFYDRFLAAFPGIHSAALAFACQIAQNIPVDVHDIRPDMIITEKGVIRPDISPQAGDQV